MPFPPFFRRLFGDNPVKPYKIRKELLPLDVDVVETFRKSLIGCLIPTTMATLPSCLGIPDGSLFLFEDYPELKEKYDTGGFNGMLLEATATSEEKDAWRGKWIKHPQGLGLYAPRLQGLFLRNGGNVGQFNRAGMPNITGLYYFRSAADASFNSPSYSGAIYYGPRGNSGPRLSVGSDNEQAVSVGLDASKSSQEYGAQSTVMPASVDMIVALYLGRVA